MQGYSLGLECRPRQKAWAAGCVCVCVFPVIGGWRQEAQKFTVPCVYTVMPKADHIGDPFSKKRSDGREKVDI